MTSFTEPRTEQSFRCLSDVGASVVLAHVAEVSLRIPLVWELRSLVRSLRQSAS